MRHASVRIALLAALVGPPASLEAQLNANGAGRVRTGIALGMTIPSGYQIDMPGDFGLHALVSAAWYRRATTAIRVDGFAQMLPGAKEIPSCIPGRVCTTVVPHPNQVYSATVSAEFRPLTGSDQVYTLAGVGAYHGRGTASTSFGTTGGGLFGIGIEFSRPTRPGFALEVRYHYLPNKFGTLAGLLTPSLAFRF